MQTQVLQREGGIDLARLQCEKNTNFQGTHILNESHIHVVDSPIHVPYGVSEYKHGDYFKRQQHNENVNILKIRFRAGQRSNGLITQPVQETLTTLQFFSNTIAEKIRGMDVVQGTPGFLLLLSRDIQK